MDPLNSKEGGVAAMKQVTNPLPGLHSHTPTVQPRWFVECVDEAEKLHAGLKWNQGELKSER